MEETKEIFTGDNLRQFVSVFPSILCVSFLFFLLCFFPSLPFSCLAFFFSLLIFLLFFFFPSLPFPSLPFSSLPPSIASPRVITLHSSSFVLMMCSPYRIQTLDLDSLDASILRLFSPPLSYLSIPFTLISIYLSPAFLFSLSFFLFFSPFSDIIIFTLPSHLSDPIFSIISITKPPPSISLQLSCHLPFPFSNFLLPSIFPFFDLS